MENKPKQIGKTKKDLKERAKIIAKSTLEGKSVTQSLKDAGYSISYANSHKNEIMENPVIQATFQQILEKAGVNDDYLSRRIAELSEAKETKFFQKDGIVTDEREVEALGIQADMIQFATKLRGHVSDKIEVSGSVELQDRLKQARERLKSK